MLSAKEQRKTQPGRTGTQCRHHWMVEKEADSEGYCAGRCKHCGNTKLFAKSINDSDGQDDDNRAHLRLDNGRATNRGHPKRY